MNEMEKLFGVVLGLVLKGVLIREIINGTSYYSLNPKYYDYGG